MRDDAWRLFLCRSAGPRLRARRAAHFSRSDFRRRAGQTLSLEGPNGAGKTSVLRILSGLLPQLEGEVRVHMSAGYVVSRRGGARPPGRLDRPSRRRERPALGDRERRNSSPRSTARACRCRACSTASVSARIADLPAQYLSAGQTPASRSGAPASSRRRPLWLLDEPFSSLDAAGRRLTAELIGEHCDDGGIAIVATHETLGLDATRHFLGAA